MFHLVVKIQKIEPDSVNVKSTPVVPVTTSLQLSVVVGGVTVIEHWAIKSGKVGILGFWVSLTVTVKLQLVMFEDESVTDQVIIVPFGIWAPSKVELELKSFNTDWIEQLSDDAVGLNSVPNTV